MKLKKYIFPVLIFAIVFVSCKQNPLKVDISNIEKEVEVIRFDEELISLNGKDTVQSWVDLSNTHPDFFNLFTYRIIKIGGINDENFTDLMKVFVTDSMIQEVKAKTDQEFSNYRKLEKQLKKAFKYYSYHFPNNELPNIYTYVSGFNQSIVTAENIIGISLDKYLGRDCEYYQQLNTTPQYKIQNMHKDKILSDVAYAWAITEFDDANSATNLLGNMVQKGKLMYLVDAMLPALQDSFKIGYTSPQIEWCEKNEAKMWTYIIEKKMLYSSKRMDIIRYINDAPSTSGFPTESPGRAGVWLGWQIVREYMEQHPETTLPELMANNNYQKILNESGYNPQ